MRPSHSCGIALGCALLTLSAGCGYYGPPRRPERHQPVVQQPAPEASSAEAATDTEPESDEEGREAEPPTDG